MQNRCAYRRGRCPEGGRARGGGVHPRRIRRFLEPALLLLLHHQPAHGYALIEALDRLGMEAYPADVSSIYRMLHDLEETGMITSTQDTEQTAGPPRRVYELTEQGEDYLTAWVQELRETDRLLHLFLEAYHEHLGGEAQHVHAAAFAGGREAEG